MSEVGYDNAHDAPLTAVKSVDLEAPAMTAPVDGMGCHAGAATMAAAARAAAAGALQPDGVFLSNGPGDPEPCDYAITAARELIESTLLLNWL